MCLASFYSFVTEEGHNHTWLGKGKEEKKGKKRGEYNNDSMETKMNLFHS